MIVDLPEHLISTVISEWLTCRDVVTLDSAWCIHKERKYWLLMLSSAFCRHLWPTEVTSKWTSKESICTYLNWIVKRAVKTKGIKITLDLSLETLLLNSAKSSDDRQITFPEVKSITLDASLFDLGLPSVSITHLFPLMEEIELCHLSSDILWQLRHALLGHPTLTKVHFTQRTSFFEELMHSMVVDVGDKLQRLTLLACLSPALLDSVSGHAPNLQELCCASNVRIPDIVHSIGRFRQLKILRVRLGNRQTAQGVQELGKLFDLDAVRRHLRSVYIGSDQLHMDVLPILTKALRSCACLQELEMCGLYLKIDVEAGQAMLKLTGQLEVTDATSADLLDFLSALSRLNLAVSLVAFGSLFVTEHVVQSFQKLPLALRITSLTLSLRDIDKPYIHALVQQCPDITTLHLMHHSNRDRRATLALFAGLVAHCPHIHTLSLHHLYNGQHAHVTNDQDVQFFVQHLQHLHTLDLTQFTTSNAVLRYLAESHKGMRKVCLSGLGITPKELCRAFGQSNPSIKLLHYQATSFHKMRTVGFGQMPITLEQLKHGLLLGASSSSTSSHK